MLTEKNIFEIAIRGEDRILELLKITVISRDGVEISRPRTRSTYAPGDIDRIRQFIGGGTPQRGERLSLSAGSEHWIIAALETVWPPEFVAEYREKHANNAAMAMQEGGET